MLECTKCKKKFKYEYEYTRHKNRKTPCVKIKKEIKCELCNLTFERLNHKIKHEQTAKHQYNINNLTFNGDHNHVGDNINNIINLTLNVQSFKNTDLSYLKKWKIEEIGDELYLKTINKSYLCLSEKVKKLFTGAIEILEHLHFNLNIEDNHNCKILLMFPGIKKAVYEYLILEIDTDTNNITWKSLQYEDFLLELLNHFTKLNNIVKNNNFTEFINYLTKYLINDPEMKSELKPHIEDKLGNLYINFNKEQKKQEREIKPSFNEKVNEYKNYRKEECTLNNGILPEIINPII
jgi:hypothetical protein